MLAQVLRILKSIYLAQAGMGQNSTIGEISRSTKIPYSTVKRRLDQAYNSGYVQCEIVSYKTTGKWVFWLTDEGKDFIACSKEMFQ